MQMSSNRPINRSVQYANELEWRPRPEVSVGFPAKSNESNNKLKTGAGLRCGRDFYIIALCK